jgi:hypothetical protein
VTVATSNLTTENGLVVGFIAFSKIIHKLE